MSAAWQALFKVLGLQQGTDKAPSFSHDSHAEVVFAFVHESPMPAYLPVVRGQQAGFPIVLVAAWSSVLGFSSP